MHDTEQHCREMESLLKRIVREEVERALSSNPSSSTFAPPSTTTVNSHVTASCTTITTNPSIGSNPNAKRSRETNGDTQLSSHPKKEKTEVRLNKLLNQIQKKTPNKQNTPKSSKSMKVQVRYQRKGICGNFVTVKQSEGGGHRFATFEAADDPSFEELKDISLKYFFPDNGKNFFNENTFQLVIRLCDSSGQELNKDESIKKYLMERGLTASRIYFLLVTEPMFDSSDSSSDDDSNALSNQRKICVVCGKTYLYFCLAC
ncbi:uncharacterized protein LOC130625972 [Hydractinia symbiolongicarpus]|nr:uncharacterized protein LOC130625972 [Hydractinia symbiolongicarpus]